MDEEEGLLPILSLLLPDLFGGVGHDSLVRLG